MSSTSWEKVGKGKGKGKTTKAQKRQEAEQMPKQTVEAAPLETQSMFRAIDDKPKIDAKQPLPNGSNHQGSPKGKQKPKKQKKQVGPEFKHKTFEDAIHDVPVLEVSEFAKQVRKTNSVWQKAVIIHMNDNISCPEESQNFSNKELKYPLSKAPKATRDMLKRFCIDETTEPVKTLLFDFCLKGIMDSMTKGQTTWGYRLGAQILAHHSPNACIEDCERHLDEISNMKNYPKKCLTYMWAIGQVGVSDIRSGMKVWLEVMLPLLGTKNLAQYVVHYLETLLNSSSNPQKDLAGTINSDQFIQIMKWMCDPTTGLAPNLRERLREVYGTVRIISTAKPEQKKAVFERFLRTPTDEILRIKAHFLDVVYQSMKENPNCLVSWSDKSTYSSSLPQTKLLLEYIGSKWNENARELPKNFEGALRTFSIINSEAASQSDQMTSMKEFKAVKTICQEFLRKLQKKSEQSRSRCNSFVFFIMIALVGVAVGLFVYDVNLHGGTVEKSATYQTLESSGTLSILKKVWAWISDVLQVIMNWLERNVPYYWSRLSDAFGPYLHSVLSLFVNFFMWLVEITAPLREAIVTNAEAVLLWADATFHKLLPGAQAIFDDIKPYLASLSQWLDKKAMAVYSLLSGEVGWCCIRDAVVSYAVVIHKAFFDLLSLIWSYLIYLFNAASDYVSGKNMQ